MWFGEALDPARLNRAQELARRCDMFLSVETSSEVFPAAALPTMAKAAGARLIEVNPVEMPLSHSADETYREPASSGLVRFRDDLVASLGQ